MEQDTNAVHMVESCATKRKLQDIPLHDMKERAPASFLVRTIYGEAQIKADDLGRAFVPDDLKVASHAATGFEKELVSEGARLGLRAAEEDRPVLFVIRHLETKPLKSKAAFCLSVERTEVCQIRYLTVAKCPTIEFKKRWKILLHVGVEAGHPIDDRKITAAGVTVKDALRDLSAVAFRAGAGPAGAFHLL